MKFCQNASPEKRALFAKSKVVNTVIVQSDPAPNSQHTSKTNEKSQGSSAKTMSSFVDTITANEIEKCDLKMAMFFYRNGSAFRIIESEVFRDLITSLRPAYAGHIKCASTLRGNLLKKTYDIIRKPTLEAINAKKGYVIITDGWTDCAGHHIVNFMIQVVGEKPFFLKSIDTSDVRMTAVNIAEMIKKVALDQGVEHWLGLLTDNANVMQKAAEIIEKEFPLVCCNGCCAHGLNLFIKNVCREKEIEQTLTKSNEIIKIVSNHTRLHHHYTQNIRTSLNISQGFAQSVETRWYSEYAMAFSVLVNKIGLRKLIEEEAKFLEESLPAKKRQQLIKIVDDNGFWKNLKMLTEGILLPARDAILFFERDTAGIEHAYSNFKKLLHTYQNLPANSLLSASTAAHLLQQDWNYMHSESMGYAYILSPQNHNFEMVGNDFAQTLNLFDKYIQVFYKNDDAKIKQAKEELDTYFVTLDQLTDEALSKIKSQSGLAYWSTHGKKFVLLAPIAKRILSIPCSSAASERCWNVFKKQHSLSRNRLDPETVEKLVFIQSNAHLLTPNDPKDYLDN